MEEHLSNENISMALNDSQADRLINSLNRIADKISNQPGQDGNTGHSQGLESDVRWHQRIGWFVIGGLVFLFGWVFIYLPREIKDAVRNLPDKADVQKAVTDGVSPLSDKMSAISEKLAGVSAQIEFLKPDAAKNLPNAMKQNLQKSGDLELGLRTVTALAKKAQEQKIAADPQEISAVGKQLLSNEDNFKPGVKPLAWDAIISLLDYHSYLNSLTFILPNTGLVPESTTFDLFPVQGKQPPNFSFVSNGAGEPIASAARFQLIGVPSNPNVKIGPSKLFAQGGAIDIDGTDIAHIIFIGSEIHYQGGPLMLEDTLFINCTFVFEHVNRSRSLATNLIASRIVDFKTS